MSSIPNNAMPHAGPSPEAETEAEEGFGVMLKERAAKLKDLARENPKTMIAAGAALVAGAVAAAAIPAVRGRKSSAGKSASGKATTAKSSRGASSGASRSKKS